jgi:hypothetical protein
MALRLDVAVIVVAIASAILWIEHGQRIDLETSADAAYAVSAGAVCPDNENVPYGADCISFMQGATAPDMLPRVGAASASAELPVAAGSACPSNNENVPYSAKCIRFMSGWFWRLNPH